MYKSIIDVVPKDNYELILTFEGDEKRVFDMKPYLNIGIFRELKDEKIFRSVRVCFDTIEWKNHADIDPETLYEESYSL